MTTVYPIRQAPRFVLRHTSGAIDGLCAFVDAGGVSQAAAVPHACSLAVAVGNVVLTHAPPNERTALLARLGPAVLSIQAAAERFGVEQPRPFQALVDLIAES